MNILMLTPDFPPENFGGIGSYVYELVRCLTKQGHKVTILLMRADYFISNAYIESTHSNLRIIAFSVKDEDTDFRINHTTSLQYYSYRSNYNAIQIIPQLGKLFSSCSFDIIATHDHYCALIFEAIKQMYPTLPTVTFIHSCRASETYYEDSIRRYVSISTNSIITVSNAVKDEIVKKYGEKTAKIYVVPGAVNTFIDANNCPEKYITYCGRLTHEKGVYVLFEAYRQLSILHPDVPPLFVLGDGPALSELKAYSHMNNLNSHVFFLGQVGFEKVQQVLKNSIIHIVPSLYEAFGLSALEAMAIGKCVIASDVGGLSEYIQNGINGFLVKPNNPIILAEKISFVLKNDALRHQISNNAAKTAKKYSFDIMSKRILDIFQETCKTYIPIPRNKI